MTRLYFISFVFMFLVSLQVKADVDWILSDPQVLQEAKALTKNLKRKITVYHWAERRYVVELPKGPLLNSDRQNHEIIEENIIDRMSRFWDIRLPVSGRSVGGGAMAPNGLYVATNPVVSRRYGGNDWLLYEFNLPKDMVFIDGRYRHGPLVGPKLTEALAERGCKNPLEVNESTPHFTARNLIKADTHQLACRQALLQIARAVEAKAILYVFTEEPLAICNAVNKWNSAFVLIEPTAIEDFSLYFYSKEPLAEDGLAEKRALFNAMFLNAEQALLYPSITPASQDEMARYTEDNYMSCNSKLRDW